MEQIDFLVQDLIPFQNEVGICSLSNEKKITGIVSKEFMEMVWLQWKN
jgi:hypothetical protein